MKAIKPCAICNENTQVPHLLCRKCFKDFGHLLHEPWMRELQQMQNRQAAIDRRECFTLYETLPNVAPHRGSPKTSSDMRNRIRKEFYELGISKQTLTNKYNISLRTLNRVLDRND